MRPIGRFSGGSVSVFSGLSDYLFCAGIFYEWITDVGLNYRF